METTLPKGPFQLIYYHYQGTNLHLKLDGRKIVVSLQRKFYTDKTWLNFNPSVDE